jgi:hypothetical protein
MIVHTLAFFRIPHSELRTEQQRFFILKQCVALVREVLYGSQGFRTREAGIRRLVRKYLAYPALRIGSSSAAAELARRYCMR